MKWNVERGSMERLYIMKKILAILVLGLLLSTSAYAMIVPSMQYVMVK